MTGCQFKNKLTLKPVTLLALNDLNYYLNKLFHEKSLNSIYRITRRDTFLHYTIF